MVKQFSADVTLLSQQKGSRLAGAVFLKTGVVGEETYIDQIGKSEAVLRTTRHADTPIIDPDHQRRKIIMLDWEHNVLLDKQDKLKILQDPTNKYTMNASYALGRAKDAAIVAAAFGDALYGKEGGSTETFTADNIVAEAATGMTVDKLRQAKRMLDNYDVDEDEPRFVALTGTQVEDLLKTTEVTSSDYNSVKALVAGQIDTFLGFKFIRLSRKVLPLTTATHMRCIAWAKTGLGLGMAQDVVGRVSERADKSYATQVYASLSIGATRLDMDKVIRVDCLEA